MLIGDQRHPGVLGVGSASLAGAVGALFLVFITVGFLVISTLLLALFFPKDRHRRGRTRPFGPVPPEFAEMEQNQR